MAHLGASLVRKQSMSRRWVKHIAGGVVTILCLFLFLRQVNLPDLRDALMNFRWGYLILGLASLAVVYVLRIARWTMLLRATEKTVTFGSCWAPFLGSIALNNVLPLRLGDAVRALVFPKAMNIARSTAVSSLLMERLIDLMTLLACLALGLFEIRTVAIPPELKSTAVFLALTGGLTLAFSFLFSGSLGRFFFHLAKNSKISRSSLLIKICEALSSLLHGFDVMSRARLLFKMFTMSMFVWFGEAGLFYFALLGIGLDGTLAVAFLIMAVATLSTLVPSSPGYVGSFHLAAFTAISLMGGTPAQAGGYAVTAHLTLWLSTTLAGAFAIWINPELFRATKIQPL
jgi:uncharacterized protein (TIRG00374 family)